MRTTSNKQNSYGNEETKRLADLEKQQQEFSDKLRTATSPVFQIVGYPRPPKSKSNTQRAKQKTPRRLVALLSAETPEELETLPERAWKAYQKFEKTLGEVLRKKKD